MFLVSFEGLDGSGKSTQAGLLAAWFRQQGLVVEMLREPGGTETSEHIRTLLLDPSQRIDPFAELLLFSAARAQLVSEKVRPLLEAGTVVICDRFFDSTTAYQGFGRELAEPAWLNAFHRQVTGGLVPHRTYLIDIEPDLARARRQARSEEDRMEASGRAFYGRVAEGYRWLAESEPDRVFRLDGAQSIESLAEAIRADAERLLAGTARSGSGNRRTP
ncbi:MAG: dTMP kinase [Rhodothermales bacterium]|nr:dTMP kinase [Rhodothermales bacterium]